MKRLEYEVRERGVTLTALAERSGVNRVTISKILHGREVPWPKWRDAIATALGWPLDRAGELFEEVEVEEVAR